MPASKPMRLLDGKTVPLRSLDLLRLFMSKKSSARSTSRAAARPPRMTPLPFCAAQPVQLGILGIVALVVVALILAPMPTAATAAACPPPSARSRRMRFTRTGKPSSSDVREPFEWEEYHAPNTTTHPAWGNCPHGWGKSPSPKMRPLWSSAARATVPMMAATSSAVPVSPT